MLDTKKQPKQAFHGMEENDETEINGKAVVEDLKLLIESITYQQEDLEFQEQALKTMASIFHTSDSASSYVVTGTGLEHILRILVSSNDKPSSLREACLHALCAACENNEKGQVLARKTKCIETLRYIFKDVFSPSCSPRIPNRMVEYLSSQCQENEALIILWQTATNSLSVCVNDPQNVENQIFCSSAFPAAVSYLRNCDSPSIQTTTLTFLTNCLANNSRCQVSFRLVGGLRAVCDVFREQLKVGCQIPSSVLKSLILTIEAAVHNNDMCRDSIAELEIVPPLLESLQLSYASPKFKVQCLITIAACIEGCDSSCKQFFSNEGMSIIVKLLAENQNCEDLQKSATCVLYTYLEETKSTIPKFLDDVLTSDQLLLDNLSLQAQKLQGNRPNPSVRNSVGTDEKIHEKPISDNKIPCNDTSTKSNNSMEQSDFANKIQDLTNEVRCLKQLFTTKEAHVQKSVTNDITKRVMDVVNTEFNSPSIFSSPNKDGKENTNTSSSYDSTHSHPDSSSSSITTGPGKDIFDNEYGSDGETLVNKERGNQCTGERNIVDRSNITNSMKHGQVTQNQENHNIVNDKANVNTNATKENISTTKPILNSKNIHQETGMPCITRAIYSSDDKCASNSDLNTKNNSYLVTDSNTNNVMDHHSVSVAENIEVVQPNIRQDIPIDRDWSDLASKQSAKAHDTQNEDEACPMVKDFDEDSFNICPNASNIIASNNKSENIRYGRKRHNSRHRTNVIESSSESSDEDFVTMDDDLKHIVTSKAPLSSSSGKRCEQLMFKCNQKMNPKCRGCRCDFATVNSRNFLRNLRCSMNTCSEHRVFVTNITTALRRYEKCLERKKRSPDFDFVGSPKLNVHCGMSPTEIMRKLKPKRKTSRHSKIEPFTMNEIETLKQGVDKYGANFSVIARNCQFRTTRSAKALKQKYRNILKSTETQHKTIRLFTAQEVNNLKAGVLKYGYRWKYILDHYNFEEGRTTQNLKDKWRNLLKAR